MAHDLSLPNDFNFTRFYLSFENALCKDYVTEKTFNALRLNTVRTQNFKCSEKLEHKYREAAVSHITHQKLKGCNTFRSTT